MQAQESSHSYLRSLRPLISAIIRSEYSTGWRTDHIRIDWNVISFSQFKKQMIAPRRLYLSPARPTSKIGCTSWARVKTNTTGQIGATLCPPTPLAIVASTKSSGSKKLVMTQAIRALIRPFLVATTVVCTFPKKGLQTPARLPATSCDTK